MPDWLKVYHQLPYPVKVLAASARGRYLSRWRYGPATESLVADYLAREQWSRAQWDAWRDERLAFVLRRAAESVPYYRAQWARRRAAGDRSSPELLSNWPVLTKEEPVSYTHLDVYKRQGRASRPTCTRSTTRA